MKILVVGGAGTIGRAVVAELREAGHTVISAGRQSGDLRLDMTSRDSIESAYAAHPDLDGVVVAAGHVAFRPIDELAESDWQAGFDSKLMGQIRLVQLGVRHLKSGVAFVLTSGILQREPVLGGASASTVNGALAGFVMAAAAELWGRARVNLVSPGVVAGEAKDEDGVFGGFVPISSERVAAAYRRALEQPISGKVLEVFDERTR
ncbi:short chain dehydrogenase [Crenobacter sp. SG2305]|uniref:short chain dehydrogenase n=1 Tax=Crenobacter oryzisoli TaxID=3056844 RepID=UPI0025AB53B1|nr:short chain dehydrogenase [Crenobacter sp. SG2305]MDN0083318.1 short chain dehydrogenase [Crenobacter sp. SG2305]